MTDFVNFYSSWSQPRADKLLPPTPVKSRSKPSSPIPIPRRKSAHPPPCSPTRGQDSPELVFNFDFSISPDASDATAHLLQRSGDLRSFPLQQKAMYTSLAALGTPHDNLAAPYAHEPFLYSVPKLPLRDTQNMHLSGITDRGLMSAPKECVATVLPLATAPSVSSMSSFQSSGPSSPTSADTTVQLDGDENFPLTSAFQRPIVSASVASSSLVDSSFREPLLSSFGAYRSPSPSPSRHARPHTHTRQVHPLMPATLQRTTTAAPVVSLNIAQADRSDRSLGIDGCLRSQSPLSGVVPSRERRSSSVGAEHDVEKMRDPGRRMGTVVGRGAGRVVSMFEYAYGSGRSLVSDEDIEQSLDKEHVQMMGEAERGRQRNEEREKATNRPRGSPELERGRARGRAPVRSGVAATRTRALPGWQWIDVQPKTTPRF